MRYSSTMQEEVPRGRTRSARARSMRFLLFFTIVVLAGIAIWLGYAAFNNSEPIPRHYRKGLDFSLYFPTQLPAGYYVDKKSFKREGNVLIFSITDKFGRTFGVSQQTAPPEALAAPQSNKPVTIPGEKNFELPIGKAHISLWGDKYVSDIVTNDGSWIIINVTSLDANQATSLTRRFVKVY